MVLLCIQATRCLPDSRGRICRAIHLSSDASVDVVESKALQFRKSAFGRLIDKVRTGGTASGSTTHDLSLALLLENRIMVDVFGSIEAVTACPADSRCTLK